MDKKLKRTILFNKHSQKINEPAGNPNPKMPIPKPEPPIPALKLNDSGDVVKWINDHPYFKWSSMCIEIGLDKSNFKRTLDNENPNIPEKYLTKIVAIIKMYGYAK